MHVEKTVRSHGGWDRIGLHVSGRVRRPRARVGWRVRGLVRQWDIEAPFIRVYLMRFRKRYEYRRDAPL